MDSVKVFDPIIISVTRTEKMLSSTGRSTSVITKEEIEQSAYTNVAELLNNEEGIYVVGAGQNPGIAARPAGD